MTTTNEQEVQRKELPDNPELLKYLIELREVKDAKAVAIAREKVLVDQVKEVLGN